MYDASWDRHIPPQPNMENVLSDPVAGPAYREAVEELTSYGDPDDAQGSLAWVFRLAAATDTIRRIMNVVPSLDRITVGFFDPEIDDREPGFGFVVYSTLDPDTVESQGNQRRPLDPRDLASDLAAEIDGQFIPTVVRIGNRQQQVSVTSPSAAMVTTWAKTAANIEGWLTPRHAVDVNTPVIFSDGTTGSVVQDWFDCIDAVLVSHVSSPLGLSKERCLRALAPKTAVMCVDQVGNVHRSHIVDVDINLGVVRNWLFPIRFSHDWSTSAAGDSGAIVLADPCGEVVGMHQGVINIRTRAAASVRRAYALCMYQLEDHGGMEVYR